jgi:hypothetical protein
MSWGAQNRSNDAKTPSVGLAMLIKPELGCCPVQPYDYGAIMGLVIGTTGMQRRTRVGKWAVHNRPPRVVVLVPHCACVQQLICAHCVPHMHMSSAVFVCICHHQRPAAGGGRWAGSSTPAPAPPDHRPQPLSALSHLRPSESQGAVCWCWGAGCCVLLGIC